MKLPILVGLRYWTRRPARSQFSLVPNRAGFFPRGSAARYIPARKLFRLGDEVPDGRGCLSIGPGSCRPRDQARQATALRPRQQKIVPAKRQRLERLRSVALIVALQLPEQ